jgi:hypothetical protein
MKREREEGERKKIQSAIEASTTGEQKEVAMLEEVVIGETPLVGTSSPEKFGLPTSGTWYYGVWLLDLMAFGELDSDILVLDIGRIYTDVSVSSRLVSFELMKINEVIDGINLFKPLVKCSKNLSWLRLLYRLLSFTLQ